MKSNSTVWWSGLTQILHFDNNNTIKMLHLTVVIVLFWPVLLPFLIFNCANHFFLALALRTKARIVLKCSFKVGITFNKFKNFIHFNHKVVFSHCTCLGQPKGVLVMSAVYLGQCEHNNCTLVHTKTAALRVIWRGGVGMAVVRVCCGVFVVWKLHDLRLTRVQGV